jgi:hemolysin activation/secretion protein
MSIPRRHRFAVTRTSSPQSDRRRLESRITAVHLAVCLPLVAGCWCRAAAIAEIELVNAADPSQPLLLKDAAALESSLRSYCGQPDKAAAHEAIADAVLAHYQTAGWPVTDVSVEKSSAGVVQVAVTEGRYGEVSVAGGSEWMRRAAFADWSRLRGAPLTADSIAESLAWLHRNPRHAGTVSFAPGRETATADTLLTLQESRPLRFAAGYRDDGAPPLGRERFYAGFEMADALGIPSWWNVEAAAGADTDEFLGARSMLRLFLPSHHEIRLSGYWTQAASTTALLPGFDAVSDLEAWNISLRMVKPLPAWRGWNSDLTAGADFFRLNTNVETAGVGTAGRAEALHFAAGVNAERRSARMRAGVNAEIAWSPGGITDAADDADHAAQRHGASADYTLVRAGAWAEHDLPAGWTLAGRASGQWSSEPVIPIQEFSPAGSAGVRGFPTASVLGDDGLQGSVEILTPLLPLPGSWKDVRAKALAFLDAAAVRDAVADDDDSLASAGAGLRMQWSDSIIMAVDYGWRLTEPGGRLHVALRMEF